MQEKDEWREQVTFWDAPGVQKNTPLGSLGSILYLFEFRLVSRTQQMLEEVSNQHCKEWTLARLAKEVAPPDKVVLQWATFGEHLGTTCVTFSTIVFWQMAKTRLLAHHA